MAFTDFFKKNKIEKEVKTPKKPMRIETLWTIILISCAVLGLCIVTSHVYIFWRLNFGNNQETLLQQQPSVVTVDRGELDTVLEAFTVREGVLEDRTVDIPTTIDPAL